VSWKATAYVKPLRTAPDGSALSRGEKFLLFILADYHNDEQRAAWPSAAALARDALMTLRHVRNLLSSLKAKGVICTSQRHSPEGDFDTNLYHFHSIDCDDSHEGGSEIISLPPLGAAGGSELHFTTGSEVEFTTVVKPGSLPVVKKLTRLYKEEPPAGTSTEPQAQPPHTHAEPPLFARAEGDVGEGVCVKSRYTFDERLAYARNRVQIQNPEGFAASRRAAEGEFDEAIGRWREGVEHPAGVKPERDTSLCPDCHGSGWWYPEGMGKGAARCRHARLDGQGTGAGPEPLPP
jgi:hypothetical protein